MKSLLMLLAVVLAAVCMNAQAGFGVPDASAPKRFAQRVSDSDHIVFYEYTLKKEITVSDRNWIQQFSDILAGAVYEPANPPFAMTAPITCYDKNGKKLFSIRCLPGEILATDDGIYKVGSKTRKAISELLKRKSG